MKTFLIRIAVAAAAFGLLATSATAARQPTKCEGLAIRSAVKTYIKWGKVAAKNATIKQIRVSTVSSSYALVRVFSRTAGPAFALMHLSSDAWGVTQFGSELSCRGVPLAVRKDLELPCTG